jgi:phosphatidylglycerophosphate synthase
MNMYAYERSVKSLNSDELINTYFMRPLAGLLVRGLYKTSITPNQVTIGAAAAGLVAALFYGQGKTGPTIVGALLLWTKDLLDSADGQLARAKNIYSRSGRFLDSIGDLVVNVAVFVAIGGALYGQTGSLTIFLLTAAALVGTTFRISYHVFYQVSYLHLENSYGLNRTNEAVQEEDLHGDRFALTLQRTYQALYGWQDRMMNAIDVWSKEGITEDVNRKWYADTKGLRFSGFLGMGSELAVLVLFSMCGRLEWYVYFNVIAQNALWAINVFYRRYLLAPRLRREVLSEGLISSSRRV